MNSQAILHICEYFQFAGSLMTDYFINCVLGSVFAVFKIKENACIGN